MQRAAIFIDGSNNYAVLKALKLKINYKELLYHFSKEKEYELLRVYYYTALRNDDKENELVKIVNWLACNGFNIVTKVVKEYKQADGSAKFKGNMDVEITVDILELSSYIQKVFLFSGDGDFCYLVKALKRKGIHVTIVSSNKVVPPVLSLALLKESDSFIDISDLPGNIISPKA